MWQQQSCLSLITFCTYQVCKICLITTKLTQECIQLPKLAFLFTKKNDNTFYINASSMAHLKDDMYVIYSGNTVHTHAILLHSPYTLNLQKLLFLPCRLELRNQPISSPFKLIRCTVANSSLFTHSADTEQH